ILRCIVHPMPTGTRTRQLSRTFRAATAQGAVPRRLSKHLSAPLLFRAPRVLKTSLPFAALAAPELNGGVNGRTCIEQRDRRQCQTPGSRTTIETNGREVTNRHQQPGCRAQNGRELLAG